MKLLVLVSGVVDPRRPVSSRVLQDAAAPRELSPFDASALECALKLRDADPATSIHALIAGPAPSEALLRSAASFRLDSVRALAADASLQWDAGAFAACLAGAVSGFAPDAVLMGREFGDFDDGVLAPCLAEALSWPFVGLAQTLSPGAAGELVLLRERGGFEERIQVHLPVLASITNDRRNRLRYPLMKNIAAAKKQRFTIAAAGVDRATLKTRLVSLADMDLDGPPGSCRMLDGDIEMQAAQLADLLRP